MTNGKITSVLHLSTSSLSWNVVHLLAPCVMSPVLLEDTTMCTSPELLDMNVVIVSIAPSTP